MGFYQQICKGGMGSLLRRFMLWVSISIILKQIWLTLWRPGSRTLLK